MIAFLICVIILVIVLEVVVSKYGNNSSMSMLDGKKEKKATNRDTTES